MAEARAPMGLLKRDHIRAMLAMPRIKALWESKHGRAADAHDVETIYACFEPLLLASLRTYTDPLPEVVQTVQLLRDAGLKIGSTTGYTRSIMQRVLPLAAAQGYAPDNLVCADDMPHGRPTPMNMYRCFVELDVWPAAAVLKVDDTAPGIAEGVAAGCPTIGLALSGNEAGIAPEQFARMSEADKAPIRQRATRSLKDAGADHVIDSVADLLPLLRRLGAV